jgi:hypothetical protein
MLVNFQGNTSMIKKRANKDHAATARDASKARNLELHANEKYAVTALPTAARGLIVPPADFEVIPHVLQFFFSVFREH